MAAVEVVFNDRTHDTSGAFWAQCHGTIATIGEGVHFLGHNIRGLPHTAGEQRGVLEDRELDVLEAGQVCLVHEGVAHLGKDGRLRRDVVRHTFGRGQGFELLLITHAL